MKLPKNSAIPLNTQQANMHQHLDGVLEGAHATLKTSVEVPCSEDRKQRHNCPPFPYLNYSTSSIDCKACPVFNGIDSHEVPDLKLGLKFYPNVILIASFGRKITSQK